MDQKAGSLRSTSAGMEEITPRIRPGHGGAFGLNGSEGIPACAAGEQQQHRMHGRNGAKGDILCGVC